MGDVSGEISIVGELFKTGVAVQAYPAAAIGIAFAVAAIAVCLQNGKYIDTVFHVHRVAGGAVTLYEFIFAGF